MPGPELTEEKIEEIITRSLKNALPDKCKYNQYMLDVDLTPAKHAEDHQKWHDFFGVVGKAGNRMLMILIGSVMALVFVVLSWGWEFLSVIFKKLNGA